MDSPEHELCLRAAAAGEAADELPSVVALQIDRVIGLSPPAGAAAIAASPIDPDLLLWPAGAFAVVFSTSRQHEVELLRSCGSSRLLACTAWSPDGDVIAAGEVGEGANVLLWRRGAGGACLHELSGHKHGIAALRFVPDGKLLASAGGVYDGHLCIWDCLSGALLLRQHIASQLSSVSFTEDGGGLLAAGPKGILKAWSLSWGHEGKGSRRSGAAAAVASAPSAGKLSLIPRQVTLRELRGASFADVALVPTPAHQPPGSGGVYALASSGVLLLLRATARTVDKAVDLQVPSAYGLAATPAAVAVACSTGIVRIFAARTLAFRVTLPRLAARGEPDGSSDSTASGSSHPDARSLSFTADGQRLLVAYADQSLVLWDVSDVKAVTCIASLAAHAGCISGVRMLPLLAEPGTEHPTPRCLTCGSDGTLRSWNLARDVAPGTGKLLVAAAAAGSGGEVQGHQPPQRLCCVVLADGGRVLLTGDSAGCVRAHDAASLALTAELEAHRGQVVALDAMAGGTLAASAGADGLVQVYDTSAADGCKALATLDEHVGTAVIGLAFAAHAGGSGVLISAGADGSLAFRSLRVATTSSYSGANKHTSGARSPCMQPIVAAVRCTCAADAPGPATCIALHPLGQCVYVAGEDGWLREWDVTSGRLVRELSPEPGAATPTALSLDPGGVIMLVGHADGALRLYAVSDGRLLARAWGHAGHIAGAALSPDLSRVLSVGDDGCMICWELSSQLAQFVHAAAARVAAARAPGLVNVAAALPHSTDASPANLAGDGLPLTGDAAAAAAAHGNTPGSSDGGLKMSLLRVRRGRGLVSSDKLPRWARSPASPSSSLSMASAGGSPRALGGGSSAGARRSQQPLLSRWFGGGGQQRSKQQRQTGSVPVPDGPSSSNPARAGGWNRAGNNSAFVQREGDPQQLLVRGCHIPTPNSSGALVGCGESVPGSGGSIGQPPASSVTAGSTIEQHGGNGVGSDAAKFSRQSGSMTTQAESEASGATALTGDAGTGLARDLFKEHFAGPEDMSLGSTTSPPVGLPSPQSVAGRQGLPLPVWDRSSSGSGGGSGGSRDSAAPSHADNHPKLLPLEVSVHPTPDGFSRSQQQQQHYLSDTDQSPQPSPRRRWRQGGMHSELEGMRERLADLQALYAEQQQRRQASPRPARSASAEDLPLPVQQEEQQQQQPSLLAELVVGPGSKKAIDPVVQQQQQQQQPSCTTTSSPTAVANCTPQPGWSPLSVRRTAGPASTTSPSPPQILPAVCADDLLQQLLFDSPAPQLLLPGGSPASHAGSAAGAGASATPGCQGSLSPVARDTSRAVRSRGRQHPGAQPLRSSDAELHVSIDSSIPAASPGAAAAQGNASVSSPQRPSQQSARRRHHQHSARRSPAAKTQQQAPSVWSHSAAAAAAAAATKPTSSPGQVVASVRRAAPAAVTLQQQKKQQQQGRQQQALLPTPCTLAPPMEGVTITPHGQHMLWPGWGPGGGDQPPWGAGASPTPSPPAAMLLAVAAVPAPGAASNSSEQSQVWLAQNPVYDMTPAGSAPPSMRPSASESGGGTAAREGADPCVPFSELEQPAGGAAVAAAAQTPHHHQQQQRQQQRWQEEQEARSLFPQADASSAAHAAAASCSTGGLMASAHVTGAAAAQQQQQQRSQATVAEAGSSSPGSSMLSLLQRIKRTMPSLRQAAGSSGGARQSRSGGGSSGGARASVSVGGADVSAGSASLRAPSRADVRQALQQREAHDAPGTVSVDEVVLLEEQLPVQLQHQPPQQQQQHRAKAAKDGNAAVATPNTATRGTDSSSSAAQRRQTAAQLAASLDHFRRSCTELQAVWSQLQSLGLDPDDASELSQLLTPTPPPRAGVLRTSPTTRTVQASGAGAGVAVGEPVAFVKQRLQEELLQSIWSLHAAVTSSTDAGSAHTLAQQGS